MQLGVRCTAVRLGVIRGAERLSKTRGRDHRSYEGGDNSDGGGDGPPKEGCRCVGWALECFRPPLVTTRNKALVLLGAVLLALAVGWRRAAPADEARRSALAAPAKKIAGSLPARSFAAEAALAAASPETSEPKATRSEAAAWLKTIYRKEQLTRELEFEQLRYGRAYWEPEANGAALATINEARAAMISQLSEEANDVLKTLFPDEAGEAIVLAEIFDADRPGPNLTFLSPESRAQFETLAAAALETAPLTPDRLLELARQILPSPQLERYLAWNAPSSAALRQQLAGFSPTEQDFTAILRASRSDGEPEQDSIERELGAARHADFKRATDPAMQTAVNDLHRLGLPIEHAGWLAELRTQAGKAIQRVWSNEALADFAKSSEAARVQQNFRREIVVHFAAHGRTIDPEFLLP